ncbi:hypothetical protein EON83_26770 [bacterium]|nr:MAG: hypothetical protein EON83_26770 [bacterium]
MFSLLRPCVVSMLCLIGLHAAPVIAADMIVATADKVADNGTSSRLSGTTNLARAVLIVTPNWSEGTKRYVTAPLGVTYKDGGWYLATLDGSILPIGSAYNIESFGALDNAWVHTATAGNTQGSSTTLDANKCTGKPPLITAVFSEGGVKNPHPVGVRWNWDMPKKVEIFNLDGAAMPEGAQFNVVFGDGFEQVDLTPIAHNSHISQVGQNERNRFLLATPLEMTPRSPLANATAGLFYDGQNWCFFNQNLAPLKKGAIVLYRGIEPPKGDPPFRNTPKVGIGGKINKVPGGLLNLPALQKKNPKLRVFVTGFTCNRESWDDILERDGKRDEVFIGAQWVKLQLTENPLNPRILADSGLLKSAIYGDPEGEGWHRIAAGSADPNVFVGGGAGGLRTGDSFPRVPYRWTGEPREDRLPFKIWEGELDYSKPEERIVVLPTIWEWDGPADFLTGFGRFLEDPNNPLGFLKIPAFFLDVNSNVRGMMAGGANTDELRERAVFPMKAAWAIGRTVSVNGDYFGDPHDRPIGIGGATSDRENPFAPYGIILTPETADWLATTDFGHGPGVISIRYKDSERFQGDYTIFVKIEKMN